MYYDNKKLAINIAELVLGIVIIVLGIMGKLESHLSGLGGSFVAVSVAQIVRNIKYRKDEDFRRRIDTEYSDERMKYLRLKAWACAGYSAVIIAGLAAIYFLFKAMMREASLCGYYVCGMLVLFLIFYVIFQKKE